MQSAIVPISRIQSAAALHSNEAPAAAQPGESTGFGQVLNNAFDQLNQTAQRSDGLAEAFAAGEDIEIHEVMVAMQETQIAFELAAQVRNRAVEAYQEIMRMQL